MASIEKHIRAVQNKERKKELLHFIDDDNLDDTAQKREKIKSLVIDMLKESYNHMVKKVDDVLHSSAVDIDGWDESYDKMILPKTILTAVLEMESTQYSGVGTSFEKQIKKDVKNIRCFI
jgi:hypothetical protein